MNDIQFIASYSDLVLSDTDYIVKMPLMILEPFLAPLLALIGVILVVSLVIYIFYFIAR